MPSYSDVNIFGIYVASFAPLMFVSWLLTLPLQHLSDRFGLSRRLWHPALFNLAIYVIVLSLLTLTVGRWL
jgi:hypothetical protein